MKLTGPRRFSLPYSHEHFLLELGKKLRQMRIDRGWSLRDMIAKHGFHLAHWQGFEKGKGVSVRSLLRLCDVFEISFEELVAGLGCVSEPALPDAAEARSAPAPKLVVKKKAKATAVPAAS